MEANLGRRGAARAVRRPSSFVPDSQSVVWGPSRVNYLTYRTYSNEQPPEDGERYERAEQEVRAKKVGLWRDLNPVPPWERRGGLTNSCVAVLDGSQLNSGRLPGNPMISLSGHLVA